MAIIPIYHKGNIVAWCTIDDVDFDEVNKNKWFLQNNTGYAVRSYRDNGKKVIVYMHRFINKTPNGLETDHVNLNKLDNRKQNLRTATQPQNTCNTKHYKNKHGFRGIAYSKHAKKYVANIRIYPKRINLGYYDTAEEAAKAYNEAAKKYHGEFAVLNEV